MPVLRFAGLFSRIITPVGVRYRETVTGRFVPFNDVQRASKTLNTLTTLRRDVLSMDDAIDLIAQYRKIQREGGDAEKFIKEELSPTV